MTIKSLDKETFISILRQHISPSNPIDSFEHLVGRSRQRESIEEALSLQGRHVFIYGDRGAGKTSLAQTVAYEHNPSSNSPVFVACGAGTNFASIIKEIAFQLIGRSRLVGTETTGNFEAGYSGLKTSETNKISERTFENFDLNAAASLLIESAASRQGKTIVVIDEFEALPSNTDRHLFAELVKQLSDRRATIALIFCGIGASLDDLLKGHNSAHRYLQEAKLPTPPLTFSGSWEIIDSAASALGLQLNEDSRLRIAQVSDGFPHYVHLICEKLFWIAHRADTEITFLTPEHYVEAVTNALTGVEARLREIYDQAVKKENDEYQAILWAVADHFELERNIKMIYSNSYERIMESIGRIPLPIEKFTSHLTSLKSNTHGNILSSSRRGWIRFSENLVRGYVRLVAESKGISLAMEHEPSPDPKYSVWMNKGPIGKAPGYSLPNYNWKSR